MLTAKDAFKQADRNSRHVIEGPLTKLTEDIEAGIKAAVASGLTSVVVPVCGMTPIELGYHSRGWSELDQKVLSTVSRDLQTLGYSVSYNWDSFEQYEYNSGNTHTGSISYGGLTSTGYSGISYGGAVSYGSRPKADAKVVFNIYWNHHGDNNSKNNY